MTETERASYWVYHYDNVLSKEYWCKSCSKKLVNLTQFEQQFSSIFCTNFSFDKKLQIQNVNAEKLSKIHSYEKSANQMLVKLTPQVSQLDAVAHGVVHRHHHFVAGKKVRKRSLISVQKRCTKQLLINFGELLYNTSSDRKKMVLSINFFVMHIFFSGRRKYVKSL